jgi:hypothetical protein
VEPRESPPAAASKPRWNWRERFLSGLWPPKRACIAITLATVRPERGAAIVEGERDESDLRLVKQVHGFTWVPL